jgi:transcriptional regulator with XRE-family HTH domain
MGDPMGQQPRKLSPELSALHKFGAELRRYRTKSGLSMAKLSREVFFSPETIGRVERGERNPSEKLVRACDETLDAGGVLVELWEEARASRPRICRHCGTPLAPTEDIYELPPKSETLLAS